MKRMLLTTCLVAALGASVSTMAVAMEAPDTIPSAADRQVVGSDAVRQIDEAPLMLAVGDAWETRSQRVSQPLTPKRSHTMLRHGVRETNPWWR